MIADHQLAPRPLAPLRAVEFLAGTRFGHQRCSALVIVAVLRIEEAVQMHDEITHMRVVDR
ncbi:MAG: hypothetical protein KDA48_08845, partial [Amphiplicatus sp.]|nr:hypothetical protein [Amphiplicatus sp.]